MILSTRRGALQLPGNYSTLIDRLRDPARLGTAQIGAGRLRVQRRLEAMRDTDKARPPDRRQNRLLERQDFDQICQEEGGVSSPDHLLTYLDANGIVFYRPGLFHGRIVLDQAWALEAIYAVFDRTGPLTEIRRSDGHFRRWHLANSVWGAFTRAEQELFISLMRSCRICFLYRRFADGNDEDGEYIAPELLPERAAVAAKLPWNPDAAGETAIFHYPLLHAGLIRAIMSDIGETAGQNAIYWQGGVWAFEANTGSRLLIEQHMTGPWQGEIRVSTQLGQAAALLGNLVARVERIQASLGMQPSKVERSSISIKSPEPLPMLIRQEKPKEPEWYVSYAWRDDKTPEGQEREKLVDQLCDAAEARGILILRDKRDLRIGDSISTFMTRIGAGDRVFVFLSDKYLHSPFCMYELLELWLTSKKDSAMLRERIRVYTLDDADIWGPLSRTRYAAFWKKEYDQLEAFVRDNGGTSILAERDFEAYKRMGDFSRDVGNILATLADSVQPRSFEELQRCGLDAD